MTGTLANPTPQSPHRRSVTLLENSEVGPEIHVLTFGLPSDDPIRFIPGQFVTFYLPRDGKTLTRSYSIYSSPEQHDRFSLLIKRVAGGFGSNLLCDLEPSGHPTLTALGPLGKFVLNDPKGRTVVLVATGVGLAPFVPMLERLRQESATTPTWLFWGNRHLAEMVRRDGFEQLARDWPQFHFVPILSRPPEDGSWKGATGHVQENVERSFTELSEADVYLCGSNRMVDQMQDLALKLNCPKGHIYVDRWGED